MHNSEIFENRLKKNHKKFHKKFLSQKTEAYRVYDKDIPEFPYQIDRYGDHAVIYEKGKKIDDDQKSEILEKLNSIKDILARVADITPENIEMKSRLIQSGKDQYNKLDTARNFFTISENGIKFRVNLSDYLDTGLFLDHRPLRAKIHKECVDAKVLNLFSYTGSFSVVCAMNRAFVTTVDMSKTYITWARENFKVNNLDPDEHLFITENCFDFLKRDNEIYDIIILDPPSFSNSKKMTSHFDIQRDHVGLINMAMKKLDWEEGVLYFSNNLRSFKLDPALSEKFNIKDITKSTIPTDFKDQKIHQCYMFTWKSP
jgi:23S rRNA G2069 N7-methylase RlmK/C1962 C5-methylase RlmI